MLVNVPLIKVMHPMLSDIVDSSNEYSNYSSRDQAMHDRDNLPAVLIEMQLNLLIKHESIELTLSM